MSDRLIQFTTFRIHADRLEAFKDSVAEAHGPQLLVELYIDERAMRACSCQLQPDSEAVLSHWALADPYVQAVMETCALERVDVYGRPNNVVLARLRALPERGNPLTVTPGFVGFGRFC